MATRTSMGGGLFAFFGLLAICGAGCSRNAVGSSPVDRSVASRAIPAADRQDELRVHTLTPSEQSYGRRAIQRVDLGPVRQGESLRRKILIENRGPKAIAIDRFEASCDCVALIGLPVSIPAGGESALSILTDETRESEFFGDLGVSVTVYCGPVAEAQFQALVSVFKK